MPSLDDDHGSSRAPSDRAHDEASRIMALCKSDGLRAFELVQQQLSVLVLRSQVLLSLSGIVITVTGFSGRAIAETSELARLSIVAGIAVVLAGGAVIVAGVLRVSWATEKIVDDPVETVAGAIRVRDRKSRFLAAGAILFTTGFALYVLAIAQLLAAAKQRP
jgi:hypothetical protein